MSEVERFVVAGLIWVTVNILRQRLAPRLPRRAQIGIVLAINLSFVAIVLWVAPSTAVLWVLLAVMAAATYQEIRMMKRAS